VNSAFAAAIVAAVVSAVVGAGSVAATFLATRATLRRDHDRQEAEFRRTMTARLYDRRVATYPGLFAATEAFRRSRLSATHDMHGHLTDAIAEIDRWHASEGLIMSNRAYEQLLGLREAVRRYLREPAGSDQLDELTDDIWTRKGQLRTAMRGDLGLLFDEDSWQSHDGD
jgi:hypothetical protein